MFLLSRMQMIWNVIIIRWNLETGNTCWPRLVLEFEMIWLWCLLLCIWNFNPLGTLEIPFDLPKLNDFAILHFSIFSPTNLERKPQIQRVNMLPTFYIMLGLLRKFQTFFSIGLASFYKSGKKVNRNFLWSN